jgi:TolB-like protein/DNA-binding winged helix-turn-helix (wHTH) protein/Tfp pilus assembly protein PilF
VLQIGDWRAEPALDQITRDSKTVKLEPRTMRVLMCLAEQAGEVVTVDQLLSTVWKDLVVTPDSVYQAVAALRKALGDDTKEPAYIVNVVRRGYRLIARVTPIEAARTVRWPWTILASTLAVVAGLLGWNFAERPVRAKTVAVLPFLDMSDTHDQQYFSDGLAEELIERLTTVPRLQVVARTSSFYFKGKQATVTQIATALAADYLLEGSVRKAGSVFRITAHLVRATDGYDLWSETYNRPIADIFSTQDEIAAAVAQALKMSVVPVEPILTSNPEAYTLYLRAFAHTNNSAASDYEAAEDELRSALVMDPQFAGAWAQLAMATIWRFDVRAPDPTTEACASARAAAERSLALAPTLSQTHRSRGIVLESCDRDLNGARAEFDRALQLQPNDPLLLMSQARLAAEEGQQNRSIELARRATAVDPLNPWTFSALGDVYLYSGHIVQAQTAYRRAIEIDPSAAYTHSALALALLTNHQAAEALEESEREPDPQYRLQLRPIALDAAGRGPDADREINELKVTYGAESADWVALFYACRHDNDAAIEWLNKYLSGRKWLPGYQPYLMNCLDSLKQDPRYRITAGQP